jgi:YVTN family beta-propeller protein
LRADDPQGLTLEQARADPRAASAGALAFDTRKDVRQAQAGVRMSRGDAGGTDGARAGASWSLGAYAGQRATWQMLSIPAQAQAAPGSGGGVVDLDRDYGGADLRGAWRGTLAGRPLAFAAGLERERSSERRRGYENFAGGTLGAVGALRRDQRDTATSRDLYAQLQWRFQPKWRATLGLRRSRIAFVDSRMVGTRPRDAKFSADGRTLWVSSETRASVTVFSMPDRRRLHTVDFDRDPGAPAAVQAVGIALGPRAFVALGRGNAVAEVDPRTFAVLRHFPAGNRVWGIGVSPDGRYLFAAAGLSGDVTVVDLARNAVKATIHTGGKPWGVVVLP